MSLSLFGDVACSKAEPVIPLIPMLNRILRSTQDDPIVNMVIKTFCGMFDTSNIDQKKQIISEGGLVILNYLSRQTPAEQSHICQAIHHLFESGHMQEVLAKRPTLLKDLGDIFRQNSDMNIVPDSTNYRAFMHSLNCMVTLCRGNRDNILQVITNGTAYRVMLVSI